VIVLLLLALLFLRVTLLVGMLEVVKVVVMVLLLLRLLFLRVLLLRMMVVT